MSRDTLITAIAVVVLIVLAVSLRSLLSFILDTPVPMAVVSSWSMEPVLHVGDLVVTTGGGSIELGEVILYRSSTHGRLIVHRVVKISGDRYTTKGDANPVADFRPVPRKNVLGKVVLVIPYVGSIRLIAEKIVGMFAFLSHS